MNKVDFLGLTQKQNYKRPETAGTIAYNKPQLFKAVPETAGSVASAGTGSTGSSCGSTVAVA